MKKSMVQVALLAAVVGLAPACATKSFVRNSVGDVNSRVDGVSKNVEDNAEKTRQLDGRVTEVDRTAQNAQTAAGRAEAAAADAAGRADAASKRVDALDAASKRILYTVVLNEAQGNFTFGKASLPDGALAALDDVAGKVKADPKGAYFEIEGHTDAIGDKAFNQKLGLERAEAVKKYLYEKHGIPLHRMNVISFGAEKPVAVNTSKDGRSQNRRVVVKVLN